MNLSEIADTLRPDRRSSLRDISAQQIKSWAEEAGNKLADAEVTRGYFLVIVEQINSVLSQCQAQAARSETINYDDVIFLEPHIAYQAGREKAGSETRRALENLKKVLANSLEIIANQTNDIDRLKDLKRLNQFFQAMAAYYTARKGA